MDLDDLGEDFLSSEVSVELLSTNQSEKLMMNGLFALINQFELHLDRITNKYKYMTLTWLLATFAGIGFFFSPQTANLGVNKHFVSCIIETFGIVGIITLWHLDTCVYQRFWGAFYLSEVTLEMRCEYLEKLTNRSLSLNTIQARISGNGLFYMGAIILLIITLAINAFFILQKTLYQVAMIGVILGFGAFIIWTIRSTGKKLQRSLETLLK